MHYTAFIGTSRVAEGPLEDVIRSVKTRPAYEQVLLLETTTCQRKDLDWRGSVESVVAQLVPVPPDGVSEPTPAKRGRPRLGVISKEITLLPRHWDWLASQSGGASATLRRLIDQARKNIDPEQQIKQQQARIFKFITIFAEQLPDFEEATRALYRKDSAQLDHSMRHWPSDIQDFVREHFHQVLNPIADA
jgi:hypothetical protein